MKAEQEIQDRLEKHLELYHSFLRDLRDFPESASSPSAWLVAAADQYKAIRTLRWVLGVDD